MITKLKLWFRIVQILKTDIIQIPSTFRIEGVVGDVDQIVRDMIEVADLGLQQTPPVRFVYENLSWGTFVSTWEQLWNIVSRVDRPNFGLALDTFHIAGSEWADPLSADGRIKNGDVMLQKSLEKMVRTIDVKKVFYVQVGDAEKLDTPLNSEHPFHVAGQPARMSWSRNARLFPFEEAGYLPFVAITEAITSKNGLGYEGCISLESFSRTAAMEGEHVPRDHARRAMHGWNTLVKTMKWEGLV